jgi:hypothetical protein
MIQSVPENKELQQRNASPIPVLILAPPLLTPLNIQTMQLTCNIPMLHQINKLTMIQSVPENKDLQQQS